MDPSSICGIKDIVLNEKVSCPLSEPVHCHIVRVCTHLVVNFIGTRVE